MGLNFCFIFFMALLQFQLPLHSVLFMRGRTCANSTFNKLGSLAELLALAKEALWLVGKVKSCPVHFLLW
jgi:hypothetical protein